LIDIDRGEDAGKSVATLRRDQARKFFFSIAINALQRLFQGCLDRVSTKA
jgi:hypothetical protein